MTSTVWPNRPASPSGPPGVLRPSARPAADAASGFGGDPSRSATWTVADTLARVAPYLPPALVRQAARERLTALAAHLRASLSSWLYMECRLAARAPEVDLAVLVDGGGRELLARDAGVGAGSHDGAGGAAWSRVRALAARWADPGDPLHAALEGVWLELDAAAAADTLDRAPAPAVFADFADALAAASPQERIRLAELALAPLLGGAVPGTVAPSLQRVVGALPAHAHLIYAGAMLSREPQTVRLCTMGLRSTELLPYLHTVGWCGPGDAVAALIAALADADVGALAPTIVHLDVPAGDRDGRAAGVLPTLGLEYPLSRREQLQGRIREAGLLDALVALGLCSRDKRDALAQWPGYETAVLRHELWPSLVARRVNHVKLTVTPSGDAQAKAYLCVHHAYRRPAPRIGRS